MEVDDLLKQKLRGRNLRATTARLQLLSAVKNYGAAMPFGEVQNSLSQLDRVTLYRTLNTLLENGILHIAANKNQEDYFALCSDTCTSQNHQHNHAHFECTNCQEISCVRLNTAVHIDLPNYQITGIEILVTGICKKCVR